MNDITNIGHAVEVQWMGEELLQRKPRYRRFRGHLRGAAWSDGMSAPIVVICPRECPSPKTEHCLGEVINGRARCFHCGRWMPMAEAIERIWDDD